MPPSRCFARLTDCGSRVVRAPDYFFVPTFIMVFTIFRYRSTTTAASTVQYSLMHSPRLSPCCSFSNIHDVSWGTKGLDKYLDKYDLGLTEQQEELLNEGDFVKQPWDDHIHEKTEHLVDDDVLDLLDKMLLWDHAARPTCQEAMKHRYFKSVRK